MRTAIPSPRGSGAAIAHAVSPASRYAEGRMICRMNQLGRSSYFCFGGKSSIRDMQRVCRAMCENQRRLGSESIRAIATLVERWPTIPTGCSPLYRNS